MTRNPLEKEGRSRDSAPAERVFAFFNEVGIIDQLASAMLAKALPDGVHPSHFAILNHLFRRGGARSPADVASAMQITRATMTHSLKVLEDRGFIRIDPNPADARGKLVSLSPAGAEFRSRAIADVSGRFGPLFGPDQLDAMGRILDDLTALRKHLDDNR